MIDDGTCYACDKAKWHSGPHSFEELGYVPPPVKTDKELREEARFTDLNHGAQLFVCGRCSAVVADWHKHTIRCH